jgi:hypothetical protein
VFGISEDLSEKIVGEAVTEKGFFSLRSQKDGSKERRFGPQADETAR